MQLIAVNRPQLEAAHHQMIEWVEKKIAGLDIQVQEEEAAQSIAERSGWKAQTSRKHLNLLARQRVFYGKIREAVQAGYMIVPNFQLNIFAIRTDAKSPAGGIREGEYNRFDQVPQLLPTGEGRYVDPHPYVQTTRKTVPGKEPGTTKTLVSQRPTELDDEIEFPVALAKPILMEEVSDAMRKMLFDEIGVAADTWSQSLSGKPDPIVVGRLRNPRKNGPAISFFIAWFFDPSRL